MVSFESNTCEITASSEPRDCDLETFAGLLGTLAVGSVSSKRSLNDLPLAGSFTGESSTKEVLTSAPPITPSLSSSLDKECDNRKGKAE